MSTLHFTHEHTFSNSYFDKMIELYFFVSGNMAISNIQIAFWICFYFCSLEYYHSLVKPNEVAEKLNTQFFLSE